MYIQVIIFFVALTILLLSANFFNNAAVAIGTFFRMPAFVIGVFIVGMGTSLPELVSAIISAKQAVSEIIPGNILGANISNVLLITGLVALINKKEIVLSKSYIFIHLHYLIGAFFIFAVIAHDGVIIWQEAIIGFVGFLIYSIYLVKNENQTVSKATVSTKEKFPVKQFVIIVAASVGIYLGAEYTISSLTEIAKGFNIPPSIIALTVLSLGSTLPEIVVNIAAIRQGKAEMAIGNILGSSIFNAMVIPAAGTIFGNINVPEQLITFSLPLMLGSGLFFYLLTHDKRISHWEGSLFVFIYLLFLIEIIL